MIGVLQHSYRLIILSNTFRSFVDSNTVLKFSKYGLLLLQHPATIFPRLKWNVHFL